MVFFLALVGASRRHISSRFSKRLLLRLQAAGWRWPTMVLSETRGLWLCWVVRGGIRWPLRLCAPKPAQDTHPRTRALSCRWKVRSLRSSTGKPCAQVACSFKCSALKRFSFLPDLQRDGGYLARQRQPRHLRLHVLLEQPEIKLSKHAIAGAGRGGRGLEQVLQLVVVVPVLGRESAPAFSCVPLVRPPCGIRRYRASPAPARSRPRTGAWCGSGAASAPVRSAPLRVPAREMEPNRAASSPDTCGTPQSCRAWPGGAAAAMPPTPHRDTRPAA